jgi:hypothetical protein
MPKGNKGGGSTYIDTSRSGEVLKVKPMTVLVGSLVFIGGVIVLHIMGKLFKNPSFDLPEDSMAD